MKINKEVSRQRELDVWRLRQQGWTQEAIAAEIGVTQPAIQQILKRLTKRFTKHNVEEIHHVKSQQIAQLEYIAYEAMLAWENSKEAAKIQRIKTSSGGKDNSEKVQELRDQDGDPRYLTVAMKAREDIRKILGADAPSKNISLDIDVSRLSDDELLAIVEGKGIS